MDQSLPDISARYSHIYLFCGKRQGALILINRGARRYNGPYRNPRMRIHRSQSAFTKLDCIRPTPVERSVRGWLMQQWPRRGRRRLLQGLDPRGCYYSQTLSDTSLCEWCRCRAPSHFVHCGPSRCGFSQPRGTTCQRSHRAIITVASTESTGSDTSGGDGAGTGEDATRLGPAQPQGQSRPRSANPHDEGEPASSQASGSGDFLASIIGTYPSTPALQFPASVTHKGAL